MEILPPRRTLATETRQIDGFIESLSCELQELFRARRELAKRYDEEGGPW